MRKVGIALLAFCLGLMACAKKEEVTPPKPEEGAIGIKGKVILIDLSGNPEKDASGVKAEVEGIGIYVMTDTDGVFLLKDVPEGSYTVLLSKEGYSPVRIENVGVEPGKSVDLGEIRVGRGVPITGKVIVKPGGPALSDITISVEGTSLICIPKPDGTYTLGPVVPGTRTLKISAATYEPATLDIEVPRDPAGLTKDITVEVEQRILFKDDFSKAYDLSKGADGPYKIYNFSAGAESWTVEKGEIVAWISAGSGSTLLEFGDPTWTDYTVEVRGKFVEATGSPSRFGVYCGRIETGNNVYCNIDVDTSSGLIRARMGTGSMENKVSTPIKFSPNTWYKFKVKVVGNKHFEFSIDDTKIGEYDGGATDGITYLVATQCKAIFDDLIVTGPVAGAPKLKAS